MTFLCRRRYRKNGEPKARTRDIHTPQPQMHENPFADDPFARHNPHDPDASSEDQREWEPRHIHSTTGKDGLEHVGGWFTGRGLTHQGADVGDDTLDQAKEMCLAEADPGFTVNRQDRGLDDALERRVYRQMTHSPPYGKGSTASNRSSVFAQSKTYFPFPSSRRISQAPSSLPADLASLSVVDDDSAYQLSIPMSVAYPRSSLVPDQSCNANVEMHCPFRVPARPESHAIPLDDQSTSGVLQQEPPSAGDRRPVPPPIPPKSPFRRATSMQSIRTKGELLR